MTHKFLAGLPVVIILLTFGCNAAEGDSKNSGLKKPGDFAAVEPAVASTEPPSEGAALFRQYCVQCHGADGKLGLNGAKDLAASLLTRAQRIDIITKGKNMMTPFGELLEPTEIEAVADYTLTFKTK